jgi:hypothetical protein
MPDDLDPDVELVQGQHAQDVEGDAPDDQVVGPPLGHEALDGVDDQAAQRAEVLLVRPPRTAGVLSGSESMLPDANEI